MNKVQNEKKVVAMLNCHADDVFCFRKEIIDALADRGFWVLVSCPYGERLEKIQRDNVIFEDIVIDRRGTNPIRDYKLYMEYLRLFKKYKPIVVLAFTIKPNVYGSLAARKLMIPYINNITGLGSGYENGGIVKQIIRIMYRIVLKSSYCVLFQNETNKNRILDDKLLPHERYKVIPGSGVNLERFTYCAYPRDDYVVFNYIGRVMKDKNIDDYLYIAERLRNKYNNLIFNIIGFIEESEIHYKVELQELESQGIIRYLGPQEDVRPFIRNSHAIIHPSTYGEGLSNVLLESAAIGRAIITTTIPGCKEIVEDGVNGFLFEPNNRQMMMEMVEKFINLPIVKKEQMGIESRRIVEDKFSRKLVVDTYEKIVEDISEANLC